MLDPLDPTSFRCAAFELVLAGFTAKNVLLNRYNVLMFFYFKRILGSRVRTFHILGLPAASPCGEDLSVPVLFLQQHCAHTGLCVLMASFRKKKS